MEQSKQETGETDLLHYVHVVRKRIWILVGVCALGLALAFLYNLRQKKVYQATSSLLINPEPPRILGRQADEVNFLGSGDYWSNQEYYSTQVKKLMTWELANRTVRSTPRKQGGEQSVGTPFWQQLVPESSTGDNKKTEKERIDEATAIVLANLKASQDPETRIVFVSVANESPQLAVALANEHVQVYMDYNLGLRTEGSGKATEYLSSELQGANGALASAEAALYEYRTKHGILDVEVEDKAGLISKEILDYSEGLRKARIERKSLESLRERVRRMKNDDVMNTPIFGLLDRGGLAATLKRSYQEEYRKFIEIDQEWGPKAEIHKKQKEKLNELKNALQREKTLAIREIEERYQVAVANEKKFAGELAAKKSEAAQFEGKMKDYLPLLRERDKAREAYQLLVKRHSTSDIAGRNKNTNVRVNDFARGARLILPRKKMNLALGFLLSLFLGTALVFLLEFLDRSVKSPKEVEDLVGAPLLGVIPSLDEAPSGNSISAMRTRYTYVAQNPRSQVAECCRAVRTNVLFSSAVRESNMLVVSSARPQEGKTTSTVFLGTVMAQSGQRVLLIETDMRRPRLHKAFGTVNRFGITTVLLGESTLEQSVVQTGVPNLDILPCGPQPPNPSELLLTEKFKSILEDAKEKYDRVLLDSPPILAVTDAVLLGRYADGAILVAHSGITAKAELKKCADSIRAVGGYVLGTILNGIDLSDASYGYYYGYGYGYGPEEGAVLADEEAGQKAAS